MLESANSTSRLGFYWHNFGTWVQCVYIIYTYIDLYIYIYTVCICGCNVIYLEGISVSSCRNILGKLPYISSLHCEWGRDTPYTYDTLLVRLHTCPISFNHVFAKI